MRFFKCQHNFFILEDDDTGNRLIAWAGSMSTGNVLLLLPTTYSSGTWKEPWKTALWIPAPLLYRWSVCYLTLSLCWAQLLNPVWAECHRALRLQRVAVPCVYWVDISSSHRTLLSHDRVLSYSLKLHF